jgi:hypothetical protein
MASGQPWENWVDRAIACPLEWPFGTKVRLLDFNREFVCMDRGGKIKFVDGIPWVDTLTKEALTNYGAVIVAEVQFPK